MKHLLTVFAITISSLAFSQVVPIIITGPPGGSLGGVTLFDVINPNSNEATITHQEDKPHFESHSQARFTISTDLAQYLFCQPNIDFEYHITYHSALGVNAGLQEPCLMFAQNPMASGGQYTNPGTVYTGTTLRFYYKFYPGRYHKSYWAIQAVYKKLSYNGVGFSDDYDNDMIRNDYTMNENETVYGIEAMHGNRLTREGDHFYADIFYGIGAHKRIRNYQVTSENLMLSPGVDYTDITMARPGNYSSVLEVITPVIGIKLGWNCLKKNSN